MNLGKEQKIAKSSTPVDVAGVTMESFTAKRLEGIGEYYFFLTRLHVKTCDLRAHATA